MGGRIWRRDARRRRPRRPRAQDIVFCCVGRDADLREVTLGDDGAFGAMKKGALFVDHTTASATIARELAAEAEKRGFEFRRCAGFRRRGRAR